MRQLPMMTGILCALALTGCAGKTAPRVAIAPLDRAKLATCLTADEAQPPDLPPYDAATLMADVAVTIDGIAAVLPAGTRVVRLDRVRERDAAAARFTVAIAGERAVCKSAALYADDFTARMSGGTR
jgi:hypothetical protein